jgi:hypothetical protein
MLYRCSGEEGYSEAPLLLCRGIMVQGNKAVYEHVLEGPHEGMKWEVLATCVYEVDLPPIMIPLVKLELPSLELAE